MQSECGIANCFTLVFEEGKQAFVLTLDQRCVERHGSSIASKEDRTCPVFSGGSTAFWGAVNSVPGRPAR